MFETTIAIAVIIGLSEVLKRAFEIRTKYIPLTAVTLGILYALTVEGTDAESIWQGVIVGLTACGLFDIGKKTVLGK